LPAGAPLGIAGAAVTAFRGALAYMPSLSLDGKKLYYLARNNVGRFMSGELWSVDLSSGHKEQLVPGISIARYTVSLDGKRVVFTRADSGGHSSIWMWPLDRHSSPLQLASWDQKLILPCFPAAVKSSSYGRKAEPITFFG
jgi:Tol biopolymer transport system component